MPPLLQLLRKFSDLKIKDEALWKIAELMAYAMFINLFLFGAEIFKEFYSGTHHMEHSQYLGRNLRSIAREKGGIIKKSGPA